MVHLEADGDDEGSVYIMCCGLVIYIGEDGAIVSPLGVDFVAQSGAEQVDCPGCLDSGERTHNRKLETVDA
jgi:hypothetical protein